VATLIRTRVSSKKTSEKIKMRVEKENLSCFCFIMYALETE